MTPDSIGNNPVPIDVQDKISELVDWLDANYELNQGSSALYWGLSYMVAAHLDKNS